MAAMDEPTIIWRVKTLEQDLREERATRRQDVEKLDDEKADAKDVARLAEEFKSLRLTLQWFMGLMAAAVVAVVVVVIQVLAS